MSVARRSRRVRFTTPFDTNLLKLIFFSPPPPFFSNFQSQSIPSSRLDSRTILHSLIPTFPHSVPYLDLSSTRSNFPLRKRIVRGQSRKFLVYAQHRHQIEEPRIRVDPREVEFGHDWNRSVAEYSRSRLDLVQVRSTLYIFLVPFLLKLKLESGGGGGKESESTSTYLSPPSSPTANLFTVLLLVLVPSSREIHPTPFNASDLVDGCERERLWQIGLGMGSLDE